MRYIKTYETLDSPYEVGDYVILYTDRDDILKIALIQFVDTVKTPPGVEK